MFGDYTLSEAAQVLGCTEEALLELVKQGVFPTHRLFWLFGPVRLDGSFIDSVAPHARTLNQQLDALVGPWISQQKQEQEQMLREIEQTKVRNEELRKQIEEEGHAFLRQLSELSEEQRKCLFPPQPGEDHAQ
jgi:hypothetical protein